MMPLGTNLSLSTRILGMIVFGLMLTSLLIGWRSEDVLEEAMLEQSKRHALIFLKGMKQEIQRNGSPLDKALMQRVLTNSTDIIEPSFGFSLLQSYAFDEHGQLIAYLGSSAPLPKNMSGHAGEVFRTGLPYLGDDIERGVDPLTGKMVHKVDIIIPLHEAGRVVAGLEVEINLEETMALIQAFDNSYELDILVIVAGSTLLVVLFIGWVVKRGLIAPLRELGALTERIAHGELSSRVSGLRQDEFGHLGDSINRMADNIEHLFDEQEQAYLQAMQSLAKALEAKDAYTARHSSRVAKYSVALGRRLGLDERQLRLLKQGAMMHDLGKIGISDTILNKPTPLDDDEFEVMREHPVFTASIMRPLKRFKEFAEIAAWHHERWDGNGYPDGLAGESIPLLARIVAIADSWDAMTGDRVYRKGMPVDKALSILENEQESGQWDPGLLRLFIEMIRGEQQARQAVEDDLFPGQPPASG